jgi:hypothetical protein
MNSSTPIRLPLALPSRFLRLPDKQASQRWVTESPSARCPKDLKSEGTIYSAMQCKFAYMLYIHIQHACMDVRQSSSPSIITHRSSSSTTTTTTTSTHSIVEPLAEATVEAFCCFPVINLRLPLSVSRLRSLPRPPSLLLADAHVSSPNHTSGSCYCPVGPYVIDVCLLPSCFTMNHEHDVELRPCPLRRLSPKPISAISSCLPLRHLCPIRVPG